MTMKGFASLIGVDGYPVAIRLSLIEAMQQSSMDDLRQADLLTGDPRRARDTTILYTATGAHTVWATVAELEAILLADALAISPGLGEDLQALCCIAVNWLQGLTPNLDKAVIATRLIRRHCPALLSGLTADRAAAPAPDGDGGTKPPPPA